MVVNLGLMLFGARLVDLTDPATLGILRAISVAIGIAYWQLTSTLLEKVEAAKAENDVKIWVPVQKVPAFMDAIFGAAPGAAPRKEYKETTLAAHEAELAKTKSGGAIMAAVQPLVMSQLLGVHILLLVRLIMLPWEAAEDPLVGKYFLGGGARDADGKPRYGELYADPAAGSEIADSSTAVAAAGTGLSTAGGAISRARDADFEEAIFRTWESADPVQVGIFEHLLGAVEGKVAAPGPAANGRDPDYRTLDQGWTPLMVVAGSPQNGRREVVRMLEVGCSAAPVDKEGWSALHWAAFHGAALPVAVLAASYGVKVGVEKGDGAGRARMPLRGTRAELATLLAALDKQGRTALALATAQEGPACAAVADVLRAAAAAAGPVPPPAAAVSSLTHLADGTKRAVPKEARVEPAGPREEDPSD